MWGGKEKARHTARRAPPTVYGGEGFLDMRFVSKHGRSLKEGSSALGRHEVAVKCGSAGLRVSANNMQN